MPNVVRTGDVGGVWGRIWQFIRLIVYGICSCSTIGYAARYPYFCQSLPSPDMPTAPSRRFSVLGLICATSGSHSEKMASHQACGRMERLNSPEWCLLREAGLPRLSAPSLVISAISSHTPRALLHSTLRCSPIQVTPRRTLPDREEMVRSAHESRRHLEAYWLERTDNMDRTGGCG
jgi:hypothetical protein